MKKLYLFPLLFLQLASCARDPTDMHYFDKDKTIFWDIVNNDLQSKKIYATNITYSKKYPLEWYTPFDFIPNDFMLNIQPRNDLELSIVDSSIKNKVYMLFFPYCESEYFNTYLIKEWDFKHSFLDFEKYIFSLTGDYSDFLEFCPAYYVNEIMIVGSDNEIAFLIDGYYIFEHNGKIMHCEEKS